MYIFVSMKYSLLFLSLCIALSASAQNSGNTKNDKSTNTYVDEMPKAEYDVNEYLANNIKYPDSARKSNITGRVIIKFVVNEDGHISDGTVVKGIGAGCDEEALRVVRSMPKWKPGKKNGQPARVYFTIPISFRLVDDKPADDAQKK